MLSQVHYKLKPLLLKPSFFNGALLDRAVFKSRSLVFLLAIVFLSACDQVNEISAQQEKIVSSKMLIKNTSPYGNDIQFSYPEFSGQYRVASHSMILSDLSRLETFDQDLLDNRKLAIRFYYPTLQQATETTDRLRVIDDNAWEYIVGHEEFSGKMLRYDNYREARWDISIDATVDNSKGSFPVLVFSHGYGFNPESYSALCGELASRGFIVVSINHTYGANPTDLGKGNIQWAKPLSIENTGNYLPIWSDDQLFVIDQLAIIDTDPNSLFYQKLNLSNLGVFGHSYGGAAAYYSASRDPRIQAVMDLDGTIFNFEDKFISQPFAFVLSRDHQPKYNYDHADNNAYEIQLMEFEHISFTDQILWWQWDHDDLDLGLGKIDAVRAIELSSNLVDDFFSTFMLSQDSQWFTQQTIQTSEFIIQNKQ